MKVSAGTISKKRIINNPKINVSIASLITFYWILIPDLTIASQPSRVYQTKPEEFQIPYSERKIQTADNYTINMWIYPPDTTVTNKKTTIVLAGGDAGNMSNLISYAYYLLRQGYTVISFDYRGFGGSSDFTITANNLYYDEFTTDIKSVIQFAQKIYPQQRIGVLAFSMGTIVTSLILGETSIDFFIAEGITNNIQLLVQRLRAQKKDKTISYPLSANQLNRNLQRTKIQILIFAGLQDTIMPINDCAKILKHHANRNVILYNGSHLEGFTILQSSYIDYIKGFLEYKKM